MGEMMLKGWIFTAGFALGCCTFVEPTTAETNFQTGISTTTGTVELEIGWPASFSNQLEIFATTNLIASDWVLACTNISTTHSASYIWVDEATNMPVRFYVAANADLDTDSDWLSDAREIYIHKTLWDIWDTDGDGLWDGFEIESGFDPRSLPGASEADIDGDGDGLPDPLELLYFGSLDQNATNDWDNDGLLNEEEFSIAMRHDDPCAIVSPWVAAPSNAATVVWGNNDEGFALLNIGFNFPFLGMNYSNLYAGVNGTCSFGSAYGAWDEVSLLPNGDAKALAAPFWSDLKKIHGNVRYFPRTNASMRSFVVSWEDVSFYDKSLSSLNFQTEIFEDGSIVFRYEEMDYAGVSSATSIGIQGHTGVDGKSWRYSNNVSGDVTNGLAVFFPARVSVIDLSSYPDKADSDGDGIADKYESESRLLNPLDAGDASGDWDFDGLSNFFEYKNGTEFDLADTDGDGFSDGVEIACGFDPTNSIDPDRALLVDSDGDGMADLWEIHCFGDLGNDAEGNFDGDLLVNGEEYLAGTDPFIKDTDGDGLNDGVDAEPLSSGPRVFFEQPKEGASVQGAFLSIKGTVEFRGSLDSVKIGNTESILSDADGYWSFSASIDMPPEGSQTLVVTASGHRQAMELASRTRLPVFVDSLPPRLAVLAAPSEAIVTSQFVHFTVQTDDSAPVLADGIEMARDGFINYVWIELDPGLNTVVVTSADKQGRTTTKSLEIYCDVPSGHTEDPPDDADQDGVPDALDYAPTDPTVQSSISITSFQNGKTIQFDSDPEAFESSRTITLAGTAGEGINSVDVHVKSLNGVLGADRYYSAEVGENTRYSLAVKLFPGTNTVTVSSGAVSEEHRVTLEIEDPRLEIRFSHSVDWFHWYDPWYVHDFEPLISESEKAGIHRFTIRALPDNVNCWFGPGGYTPRTISYKLDVLLYDRLVLSKTGTLTPVVVVSEDRSYNGIDTWLYYGYYKPETVSVVVHADMYAGAYVVDGDYRDICPQGKVLGRKANPYRVKYSLDQNWQTEGFADMFANSQLELSGPNAGEPVYLLTGQSAQFSLRGISPDDEAGLKDLYSGLTLFGMDGDEQAVVDALGVFSALTPDHYQVGIKENFIMKPDGTYYTSNDVPNIDVFVIDPPRLVPDFSRDGTISETDERLAASGESFRFWVNDDDDSGDISEDGSDVPGQGGLFDNANYEDSEVNGRSDLLDFFPVWLDLHDTLSMLPPGGGVEYKLRHDDEAVRFVYTDLTIGQADAYRTTEGNTYGPSFNQNSFEADTIKVTDSGILLNASFLNRISSDPDKGVLMAEGIKPSTKPLVLEIWNDGIKRAEGELNLSLSGVEHMYRWINLRGEIGGNENRESDTTEPANFPDSSSNGKNFVFVHGYSVHEEAARAWNAEMFKRLYQSGSHAMFTAVAWRGNSSQIWSWIPFVGGSTPDYYENVENAFATAPHLVAQINNLPGEKVIAGHSLGNMVVSSAIVDHGLDVNAYFMLNAAVAMEAYDPAAENIDDMRHPDWQNYSNRLWASEWHALFPISDNRSKLTWRDRFGEIPIALNYHSSTEDVLANSDGNVPNLGRVQAWVCQEMRKGTTLLWIAPGNAEAGWGFNLDYVGLTAPQANALLGSAIRTNSFFLHFDDEELYADTGSAFLQDDELDVRNSVIYRRLLADAIPSVSNPSGRNSLGNSVQDNVDFMKFKRGDFDDGNWPRSLDEWRHSDVKNVAHPFNHGVFKRIVTDGGVK